MKKVKYDGKSIHKLMDKAISDSASNATKGGWCCGRPPKYQSWRDDDDDDYADDDD